MIDIFNENIIPTIEDVKTLELEIEKIKNIKSNKAHTHSEYVKTSDIANFIVDIKIENDNLILTTYSGSKTIIKL